MPAARATIKCSRRCACICATSTHSLHAGALEVAAALDALAVRDGSIALPGYTHMQQAMPSTVALWALGFAAEIRDDAQGLHQAMRRANKNPLGSAAGYGTPNLDVSRESTRRRLSFEVTHEPVTAVQLSRGKAEAQLLFEITLLTQDIGRLAADLVLFYTQEFGFVSLPEGFTTGSSIMPQKRNPDVFELMRGRSAVAQAALNEVLGITQKMTSGLPPRSAAHQAAPVPRDRLLSADARYPAERPCRGSLQAGQHSPGSRHSCRGGRERLGGEGEYSVP